jgi:5-aminopentanamidase
MVVGVAQTRPALGDLERNLERCEATLEGAAAAGCSLVVLPECALSGYMFERPEDAVRAADEVPGASTEALVRACRRHGLHAVVGLLEREGDLLRNTAVLAGPDGIVGRYRKGHLPDLGVDRFVTPGDGPYEPFETPLGRIGIEICYELRFPEVARAYALAGADVIAHPTNWPSTVTSVADFVTRARAYENHVFLLTADRVGREGWAEFGGWSQIVDPGGRRVAQAQEGEEGLVTAEIDVREARVKDLAPEPGRYEIHLFDDRRPELYGALVEQSDRAIVV